MYIPGNATATGASTSVSGALNSTSWPSLMGVLGQLETPSDSGALNSTNWPSRMGVLSQWRNPSDVLTVLLIIGGDVIQKALAQLSGGYIVPVAFSFGWVTYSFNALYVALGEGSLMPVCDFPSILIDAKSGHSRKNLSWALGRVLRGAQHQKGLPIRALNVTVYRCCGRSGGQKHDWLWWSGIATILVQLVIASIPFIREGDWIILMSTAVGSGLSLTTGALPRWKQEKWRGRAEKKEKVYCLTQGNGHQHVVIIRNAQGSVNLDDMAASSSNIEGCSVGTRIGLAILALLWIVLLINIAGLEWNTWYLLAVGLIGMIQNITVASVPRPPTTLGLDLTLEKRLFGEKVMEALMQTEKLLPGVGAALVTVFFPGGLNESEIEYWSTSPGFNSLQKRLTQPSSEKSEFSV